MEHNELLSGVEFELLCKNLIDKMGFVTEITKASSDGGIDIIAYSNKPMISGKYIVQCKRYSGNVGEPIIRDLYGVITAERANKGILITTGSFTKAATQFAENKQIELINGYELSKLLEIYHIDHTLSPLGSLQKTIVQILNDNFVSTDSYDEKIVLLNNNPNDEITRVKIIALLLGYISGLIQFIDLNADKILVISEIQKHIELYFRYSKVNKKNQNMHFILKMLNIQLCILTGEFSKATEEYIKLFNQPELCFHSLSDMSNNLKQNEWIVYCLYFTIYNMVQVSLLSNNKLFTEKIYQIGHYVIELIRTVYALQSVNIDDDLTESQVNYANEQLEILENMKTLNSIYLFDDVFINSCIDYTYYNGKLPTKVFDNFPVSASNDNILVKNNNLELFRVENVRENITTALKYI